MATSVQRLYCTQQADLAMIRRHKVALASIYAAVLMSRNRSHALDRVWVVSMMTSSGVNDDYQIPRRLVAECDS